MYYILASISCALYSLYYGFSDSFAATNYAFDFGLVPRTPEFRASGNVAFWGVHNPPTSKFNMHVCVCARARDSATP